MLRSTQGWASGIQDRRPGIPSSHHGAIGPPPGIPGLPGISGTLSGGITMRPRAMMTKPLPRLRHDPPAPPCRRPGVPLAAAAASSRLLAALLLAAVLPLAGCGRRQPPNLLLITLDT